MNRLVLILAVFICFSCSKNMHLNKEKNFSASENLMLSQVKIVNPSFQKILSQIDSSIEIFEKGVNADRGRKVNYYITAKSFCRNDSSFIMLKAMTGSYFLYGLQNEIDERMLERLRLVEGVESQVLLNSDFEDQFCDSNFVNLVEECFKQDTFRFQWYKDKDKNWSLDLYPTFTELYYYSKSKLVFINRAFPKVLVRIK